MFSRPCLFQGFLSYDCVEELYAAMKSQDLSEVVFTALKVLKRTQNLPPMTIAMKSEEVSENHRTNGNNAYSEGKYQQALICYNRALLHAPKNSRAYKIAISNRSALFFKVKANTACVKDIDTCFALGCPPEIIDKIIKRKEEANASINFDNFITGLYETSSDLYMNCNISRNSQVPCAASVVKFTGSNIPKVVAGEDIKVGTVVAVEKAYVSLTIPQNSTFACHYCQRMSLNLIPCDTCCTAMYCNEDCEKQCYDEYHKYECQIMNVIQLVCQGPLPNLMVKIILKLKSKCQSWKEIIEMSQKLGLERMETSSIEEIFDSNQLFSCLNIQDDKPFVCGIIYNVSFVCAAMLHYFGEIPSFFPENELEKQKAMRATAKIMMFLAVYMSPLQLLQVITNVCQSITHINDTPNYGLFTFTGKLKNSCDPNVFVINKNNELILLAIKTIKAGEELTISFPRHWCDVEMARHKRNILNYLFKGNVCDCPMCSGNYKDLKQLNGIQKKYYRCLDLSSMEDSIISVNMSNVFTKLLEAMDVLNNVQYTTEFKEIYKRFRKCLMFYEFAKGQNFILN